MTKDYQSLSDYLGVDLPIRSGVVGDVHLDSRNVTGGDIFIAIKGSADRHGIEYVAAAFKNGAALVLTDSELKISDVDSTRVVFIADLADRLGELAKWRYGEAGYPKVVAVTGTNGKTSVAWFIAQLLNLNGQRCGYIGTLGTGAIDDLTPSNLTTPNVFSLHRMLAEAQQQGFTWMSVEASSHALDQGRLDGIAITGAVFTTFSRDHLDYHETMEAYLAAKVRLLYRSELNWAVINEILLPHGINEIVDTTLTYGGEGANVPYSVAPTENGLDIEAMLAGDVIKFKPALFGRYQGENLIAALIAATLICDVPLTELRGINEVSAPIGRMQVFNANNVHFIVDYAHTPDALGTALLNLREHQASGDLWAVIGCGGDRDKGKRPQMGAVAENIADFIVVTNDNPRSEDEMVIAKEIVAGMKAPDKTTIIIDRAEAIHHTITAAKAGDFVLIAGKGHEEYQEINGVRHPFSDQAQLVGAGAKAGVVNG